MCILGLGMMHKIEGCLNQYGYQKKLEEHLHNIIKKNMI